MNIPDRALTGSSVELSLTNALDRKSLLRCDLERLLGRDYLTAPGGWLINVEIDNSSASIGGSLVWGAGGIMHQTELVITNSDSFYVPAPNFDLSVHWREDLGGPSGIVGRPVRVRGTASRAVRGPQPRQIVAYDFPAGTGAPIDHDIPRFASKMSLLGPPGDSEAFSPGVQYYLVGGAAPFAQPIWGPDLQRILSTIGFVDVSSYASLEIQGMTSANGWTLPKTLFVDYRLEL